MKRVSFNAHHPQQSVTPTTLYMLWNNGSRRTECLRPSLYTLKHILDQLPNSHGMRPFQTGLEAQSPRRRTIKHLARLYETIALVECLQTT